MSLMVFFSYMLPPFHQNLCRHLIIKQIPILLQFQTPFPLQYFVVPRYKNHDHYIGCLHYDDLFRHMFGKEIMSRRFTFESDIWRSAASTFYSGNTFRHYFCDDKSFFLKNNFLMSGNKNINNNNIFNKRIKHFW